MNSGPAAPIEIIGLSRVVNCASLFKKESAIGKADISSNSQVFGSIAYFLVRLQQLFRRIVRPAQEIIQVRTPMVRDHNKKGDIKFFSYSINYGQFIHAFGTKVSK